MPGSVTRMRASSGRALGGVMGNPDITDPTFHLHTAQGRQLSAPVHQIVYLHQVDDIGAQTARPSGCICSIPRALPVVQTLVARKARGPAPISASKSPMTASVRPYIGGLSI